MPRASFAPRWTPAFAGVTAVMLGVLLPACSRQPESQPVPTARSTVPGATAIDCAPGGATDFRPVCALEKQGATLTLRNPDGGFHKVTITEDGRGVQASDGAEPVRVVLADPFTIEVTAGRDRYHLPATAKVPL